MDPLNTTQLKEESLRWIFSILGAVLVYLIVANITVAVYHPDIDALNAMANKLLAEPSYARPEPMEAMLFRLGVITIIPAMLGFYMLFSKSTLPGKLAKDPIYLAISVIIIASIAALIFYDFTALNPYGPGNGDVPQNARDGVSNTNFDFYFSGIFLGNYTWLYLFVITPLVACLFFIGFKKKGWDSNRSFNIISSVAGYTVIGLSLAAIVAMNTFNFPYANDNKFDFSAAYYSTTQVYAGLPMLVNHFTATYGLYPHFLNPLFQITGLSIMKFSLVMSLLLAVAFLFQFYFLGRFVSNKIIWFLGCATILFFPYLDFKFTNPFDCLFSAYPIRYLIPCTVSLLATIYLLKGSVKVYWATFFVSALFILWNPEMGLVCYLAWIVTNVYHDFFAADGKIATRKILQHIITGLCMAVAVFYAYKLLIWACYGTAPDMSLLFSSIVIFGQLGFYMLPMSLVHPWNLMAVIIIIGFAYAIIKWYKKEITPKSSIILLVSVIALGYFLYFQGRSQDANFSLSSGFCLTLLILLGDELWKIVKVASVPLFNALFVVFLVFTSFSFMEIVAGHQKMLELVYQEEDKAAQAPTQGTDESVTDFITKKSVAKEKIIVLVQKKSQALFFDGNKRQSAFNPGFIDLCYMADADRFENILADSSFSVFMQPTEHTYSYQARSFAALAATYEFTAVNKNMVLLNKRKNKIPKKTFFTNTNQVIIHRKYGDDSAGIRLRINDNLGINTPVPFTQQFSVSTLFYLVPQMFPSATIIANTIDSEGFVIANVYNTSKMRFAVNNRSIELQPPVFQWVYCIMNVYPGYFEVYINGALYFRGLLSHPASTMAKRISVGNRGTAIDYHNFVGAIAEVAVANQVIDTNTIHDTWRQIQEAVGK